MKVTRRTLAKVAAMLTVSGAIPVIKATAKVPAYPTSPNLKPQMIGLMHYVEPNTFFNGELKLPYGYWATSYVDDLSEIPQWGDCFSHWPEVDMGPAIKWSGIPTPDQQIELDGQSFKAAHHDMMTEFVYGEQRYIRHRDGSLTDLGCDDQTA